MSKERRSYQNPLKISRAIGVRKGMTVVDLGCGPGYFTLPLASLVGPLGLVYAVESNPTMITYLRANMRKSSANTKAIKIIRADVSKTRIPAASADMVLFARLLHDITDKKAFLREVGRICKPGGKVIDLDWKKIRMNHGPPYRVCLSKPRSKKVITRNGFMFVRDFDPGPYHYGLIFRPST